jgi:hypothetical protein
VELASFAYCPEQWRQEYGVTPTFRPPAAK